MLSIEEVEHIADLARLELTEEEKAMFAEQLSSILDYVQKLNEVDTEGVEPTSQVTGLENVMRPDEIEEASAEEKEGILANAPQSEENLFKIKKVFE